MRYFGNAVLGAKLSASACSLSHFGSDALRPPEAIFTAGTSGIPLALVHHLRRHRVLHDCVLLVSTMITDAPRADSEDRVQADTGCPAIPSNWPASRAFVQANLMTAHSRASEECR